MAVSNDVRVSLRTPTKSRAFTIAAALTVAIGHRVQRENDQGDVEPSPTQEIPPTDRRPAHCNV